MDRKKVKLCILGSSFENFILLIKFFFDFKTLFLIFTNNVFRMSITVAENDTINSKMLQIVLCDTY